MNHQCKQCHALHWLSERRVKSLVANAQYGVCCLQGKVVIDYVIPIPHELSQLYEADEDDAREFCSHIHCYNKAFAFTSAGGSFCLDGTIFDGCEPLMYKIQDEIFHQIRPLLPENVFLLCTANYIFTIPWRLSNTEVIIICKPAKRQCRHYRKFW